MTAGTISRRPAAVVPWSRIVSTRGRIEIGVIAALLIWLYWDQLARMYAIWSSDVDWSHGFLILPFSLYLIHARRAELARTPLRPSLAGGLLMLAGMAGYAYCIRARIGYPQPLSIIPVLMGVVLLMAGWKMLWNTLFPILFLVLAMPPPVRLYRDVTQPLQNLAAAAATPILRIVTGMQIERFGINLIPYDAEGHERHAITVAGACSGMNSLLAFAAIGLAMAYFSRRPLWQRGVMILAVIPVALTCNVFRVVVTGALMINGLDKWATGTPHQVLGLLTFGLGMLIYSAILWVMDHLFIEEEPSS